MWFGGGRNFTEMSGGELFGSGSAAGVAVTFSQLQLPCPLFLSLCKSVLKSLVDGKSIEIPYVATIKSIDSSFKPFTSSKQVPGSVVPVPHQCKQYKYT